MKEKDINSLKELEKAISKLDESHFKIGKALLDKAIYLQEKLDELQNDINDKGLNIEMQQGTYSITRANPSCDTYNKFLKHYTSIIKQLNEMLPKIADEDLDAKSEFAL